MVKGKIKRNFIDSEEPVFKLSMSFAGIPVPHFPFVS